MSKGIVLSTKPELLVRITATGARGQSAYEAARAAGFAGTEHEFNAGLAQAGGGASVLAYASQTEFPVAGRENVLYVDSAANAVYRYDAASGAYRALGESLAEIALLHGGHAAG